MNTVASFCPPVLTEKWLHLSLVTAVIYGHFVIDSFGLDPPPEWDKAEEPVNWIIFALSYVMIGDLEVKKKKKATEGIPTHWLLWHRAAPSLTVSSTFTHLITHTPKQPFNT